MPDTARPPCRARNRRPGGRAERQRLRAAGPAPEAAPARPGFPGGQYRPLSDAEVEQVHRAALEVLERVGMGESPPALIEQAVAAGARMDGRGRLTFPRAMVEDIIAGASRNLVLHGRDPRHDLELTGTRVYYGTGGAAVRTLDLDTATYRPSTLADLYDFARLVDCLENVCWFTRCVVATDVTDGLDLDVNTAYAIASGTTKLLGMSFVTGENVRPVVEMFDLMLGGPGRFRERPFCKAHISPVVSPLRFGADAVAVGIAAIAEGMPINSIIGAQAGATAPAPPAGALVQTVAETLAGLVMVNVFAPGYPMVFSNWPLVSDLRTGAFSGSGGEISVLNAAAAQMSNFYDLPGGVSASMADSKIPDAQAGFEKAVSTVATGLAGANLVYESAGMFASLIGCSFEGFVIDNEMLSTVQRLVRGIEVNDETLSVDVIEEVALGAGHFLGHPQTLAAMERDYYYPELSDRETPDEWAEGGGRDLWGRARDKARRILAAHYPDSIPEETDARIRERFDIALPRERMRRS